MRKRETTQHLDFFRSTLPLSRIHREEENRCPLPSLCVSCSLIFSIQTTGLLKMGLSCQGRGRGLKAMYGIHPHHIAPHRTSWIFNVSLWLQWDTLIKVEAESCRFLEMLVGLCCSHRDAWVLPLTDQISHRFQHWLPLTRLDLFNLQHTFINSVVQLVTMLALLLFLLSCLSLVPLSPAEKGLEFPQYDGKDRVIDITDKNYKKALKKHSMMCLFYHGPVPDSKELQKQHQMTELVLEVKYLYIKRKQEQERGTFSVAVRLCYVVEFEQLLVRVLCMQAVGQRSRLAGGIFVILWKCLNCRVTSDWLGGESLLQQSSVQRKFFNFYH